MKPDQRKTHKMADMLFEDGDWALMLGPISWMMDSKRYFLHHTCTVEDEEGDAKWQTWFDPEHLTEYPWCAFCDSKPPDALRGLHKAMVYL